MIFDQLNATESEIESINEAEQNNLDHVNEDDAPFVSNRSHRKNITWNYELEYVLVQQIFRNKAYIDTPNKKLSEKWEGVITDVFNHKLFKGKIILS